MNIGDLDLACLGNPQLSSYILGFVLGDGYVTPQNLVGFCSTDRPVVEQIKEIFRSSNQIYSSKPYNSRYLGADAQGHQLRVTSAILADWLREHGVWERKSDLDSWDGRALMVPNQGDWEFLRGWWETDGGWNVSSGYYWVNNSIQFLEHVKGWLIKRDLPAAVYPGDGVYILSLSGKHNSWRLRNLMYPKLVEKVPCISRKRLMAESVRLLSRNNLGRWLTALFGYPGESFPVLTRKYRESSWKVTRPASRVIIVKGGVATMLERGGERITSFRDEEISGLAIVTISLREYEEVVGSFGLG